MQTEEILRDIYDVGRRFESLRGNRGLMRFCSSETLLVYELARAEEEGRKVIASDLAKALGVTRSAVSQTLAKLEKKGTVRRFSDGHGGVSVELTARAHGEYEENRRWLGDFLAPVVERLGEEPVRLMFRGIRRFFDEVEAEIARRTAAPAEPAASPAR